MGHFLWPSRPLPSSVSLAEISCRTFRICLNLALVYSGNKYCQTWPQLSCKQGQALYLSCRSWLKSGLGWHGLVSGLADASVARLRAGGSAVAALNWGARLLVKGPLPGIICTFLIGFGPWSNHLNERGHLSRDPARNSPTHAGLSSNFALMTIS